MSGSQQWNGRSKIDYRRNNCLRIVIWASFILYFAAMAPVRSAAVGQVGQEHAGQRPWNFTLRDLEGRPHSAEEWAQAKAVVLFFIATECPISNRYAPEINRIVAEYSPKNVLFLAVHSDPDLTAEEALHHARDFGYKFTILLDPEQTMAHYLGVELTPTTAILSPKREVLYRGRIDNRYPELGQYRESGVKPDLQLALDAVLSNRPVAEPVTKSIGCQLPPARKGRR